MSVASQNPFALLDDDPSERAASQPKKETPAPAPAPQQKQRSNAPRGGKFYQRGGRPKDAGAGGEEAAAAADDSGRRKFDSRGGRGRDDRGDRGDRGGRGRGRGGRGRGGGGDRPDRHSATGKTDTEKKVSQGWGADEGGAELKAEESGAADAVNDWNSPTADGDAWGATPAAGGDDPWGAAAPAAAEGDAAAAGGEGGAKPEGGERRRREREEEEEDNTLSYEQYLAQKKEAEAAQTPALDVRRANDGTDDWQSNLQALKKADEDEDAYFVGKAKAAPKARAKKEEKVFLEIDARFERPNRGGRGGRGGDRGGFRGEGRGRGRGRGEGRGGGEGGRGAARGTRTNGQALNVADESAFPSLS